MEEGKGRYTPRPLITFAEDPDPPEEDNWEYYHEVVVSHRRTVVKLHGMRLTRCGGGYRVDRRARGNY